LPTSPRIPPELRLKLEELFRRAEIPEGWGCSIEDFTCAVERSVGARFRDSQTSAREISAYLETLHLQDLALSYCCAAGNSVAWEHFVAQFRPELYRAARAIAGDSVGRDLADSLYAELYGLESREGHRRSLFDYFHGRSKLSTWLRAILAQRHVDDIRRTRRTESLDDPESQAGDPPQVQPAAAGDGTDPERSRYLVLVQTVLAAALAGLAARDRLRLAYYYVDDLTLAQIGRLLGEHEATVSRKLERVRRELRKNVDGELRNKKRLSEAQVQLCYEYAQQEWPFDLTHALSSKGSIPK
jgi:RNA polymerase sigma factor (sigma-70 family)